MSSDPKVETTAPASRAVEPGRAARRSHPLAIGFLGTVAATLLLLMVAGTVVVAKPLVPPRAALVVTGLVSGAAGTAQTMTVTALKDGKTDAGYRGTIVVTSSDGQAVLPAAYTFTARDRGRRSFAVTLTTAGSSTVTASDAVAGSTGSQTVSVSPAAASVFALSGLADATAGTSQALTLTARDAFGNVATGYRGTVAVTANDPQATLPANHTFTAGDAGSHAFSVVLKTAGALQTVTATDTGSAGLTTSATAAIGSGAAVDLTLSTTLSRIHRGQPVATAGQAFGLDVTAVDQYGNRAAGYTGLVELAASDGLTDLPDGPGGAGFVQFGAADAGRVTIPDVAFFSKRIYLEHASLSAVDVGDTQLAADQDFQVLPGPAVRYADCPTATTRAGTAYQEVAHIGVNDMIGLKFIALDAYGNDATNRQSAIGIDLHPVGYEADATLQVSDPQVVYDTNGQVATFSASPSRIDPPVVLTLRTAGEQTVTVTDPDDPALTVTCTYTVAGPTAFTGTIELPDPRTSGNTVVGFATFRYLPPNDHGYTIEQLSGPVALDLDGQVRPLGTVEVLGAGSLPVVIWDLLPAAPPAERTLTCDTTVACAPPDPLHIDYVLRDAFGNASTGAITIKLWSGELPRPNVTYEGDTILVATSAGLSLGVIYTGEVLSSGNGSATIKIGLDAAMNVGIAAGTSLIAGSPVGVILDKPLVVDGTALECEPGPGISCHTGSFVGVTLIPGDPDDPTPDQTALTGYQTMGTDTCGFFDGLETCPAITLELLPPPLGSGHPPTGEVGVPYGPFQFEATASKDEVLTYTKVFGVLPPGILLQTDGTLSGTPTTAGIYTFTLSVTGPISNGTTDIFTILVTD